MQLDVDDSVITGLDFDVGCDVMLSKHARSVMWQHWHDVFAQIGVFAMSLRADVAEAVDEKLDSLVKQHSSLFRVSMFK